MLQSKITRRYSNVIHSYDHFSLNQYIQADEGHGTHVDQNTKKKLLKDIYAFYLKVKGKRKLLRLDDSTSIDKAFILIADEIIHIDCMFEIELCSNTLIGKHINNPYNVGFIPLKPFLDMRKDKEFFKFLKEIIQNYKWCNHSVFDNYLIESIEEMEEREIEQIKAEALCQGENLRYNANYNYVKILKRIINPFISSLKETFTVFNPNIIEKHCKNHPKWKEFIMDSIECFDEGQSKYLSLTGMMSEEDKDNGYLDLSDSFMFAWDYYEYGNNDFNGVINWHINNGGNESIEEPYAATELNTHTYENLQKAYKIGKSITKPYMKRYDCFEPKK